MCLQAAQKSGDIVWQANAFTELGFLKMVQEDWALAEEFMLGAQRIWDDVPDQRIAQARIRRYQGVLAINRQQYDQAIVLHEDVQARLAQLTNPPETQLDVAYFWLHTSRMEVFYRLGDLARAKAQGDIAGQYYKKINETGSYRARDYKVIFGDVLFSLGDLNAAIITWNDMLSFSDGLPLQVEEGDALSRLGWVKIHQEDAEQALALLEQARQIFVKYGQAKKIRRLANLIERIEAVQDVPGFKEIFSLW
jgi:tetratricopeptide (TPR) repeat protein